jgi:hypothetical protein
MGVSRCSHLNPVSVMIATLALAGLLACSTTRTGRGQGIPRGTSPEEFVSLLTERLGLSAEQVQQVRPVIEAHWEKRRGIIEKYRGQGRWSPGSVQAEFQELRQATEGQLASILTEEQMEEYRELREEQRQTMRERRRGRRRRGF